MTDRSEPTNRPWPEVSDARRLYDHGQPWCINAHAHPDANGGYPDPQRHLPWHECRSRETYVDDARRDLDGDMLGLSVYAAARFRFGETRSLASPTSACVVLESWLPDSAEGAQRVSLKPAEALRLARVLVHLVDALTFVNRRV